ncbi:MAG: AAA family ATPase [Acidimicrobiales bacterium]|nr:AAA family ATPase [Acidimicrobiales bacterium]
MGGQVEAWILGDARPACPMTGSPAGSAVRETHLSILLFLGERVFKLHKPLRFDFADFSTLSSRVEACRREVDLNRRLAPDVYLGVADVTMEGETLDQVVVMRRLPAERSLAHLACSGPEAVVVAEVKKVARALADFHARAERSAEISACASAQGIADQFEKNVLAMAPFVGPVLDRDVHAAVVSGVRRYLAGRASLFSARIALGQICDGHGDLQADDIYCLDDGPRILDCLEFDDRLRYGDVAADVAFLAMDLERLGAEAPATQFVRDYEEAAGALSPRSLLHFYIALRAYVRTKVTCIRHGQGDPGAADQAARLLKLAEVHLERARVRLVLVGGVPGSGKSTLATVLGDALGATVLRSDERRRGRSGQKEARPPARTFARGPYTPLGKQEVYDDLIETARAHLALGESVVLDASWIDESHRRMARRLATESIADLTELHCTAPPAVVERRIALRLRNGDDASEASVEIGRAMARTEAPWPSAADVDTTRPLGVVLDEALKLIGVGLDHPEDRS